MASDTVMTVDDLRRFMVEVFPQVHRDFTVVSVGPMTASVRLEVGERHLRPGGTVSGPAMFGVADVSMYVAVLAMIGPEALAVTTNMSIDFMRKPEAGRPVTAECRILKLGRALAVGDVLLYSEGVDSPVARAGVTYSIPPGRGARDARAGARSGLGDRADPV